MVTFARTCVERSSGAPAPRLSTECFANLGGDHQGGVDEASGEGNERGDHPVAPRVHRAEAGAADEAARARRGRGRALGAEEPVDRGAHAEGTVFTKGPTLRAREASTDPKRRSMPRRDLSRQMTRYKERRSRAAPSYRASRRREPRRREPRSSDSGGVSRVKFFARRRPGEERRVPAGVRRRVPRSASARRPTCRAGTASRAAWSGSTGSRAPATGTPSTTATAPGLEGTRRTSSRSQGASVVEEDEAEAEVEALRDGVGATWRLLTVPRRSGESGEEWTSRSSRIRKIEEPGLGGDRRRSSSSRDGRALRRRRRDCRLRHGPSTCARPGRRSRG